jgi:predicted transcriptional regulator
MQTRLDWKLFRKRRKELGLTQLDVAKRGKTSQSMVQQIETGQREDPHWSTVLRLCWALGFKLDEVAK